MNGLEHGQALKRQVSNVGLLNADELGEELYSLDARLPRDLVFILDRQVDGFKQDRMVAVVLVYMLSHLNVLVDALNLAIDCGK